MSLSGSIVGGSAAKRVRLSRCPHSLAGIIPALRTISYVSATISDFAFRVDLIKKTTNTVLYISNKEQIQICENRKMKINLSLDSSAQISFIYQLTQIQLHCREIIKKFIYRFLCYPSFNSLDPNEKNASSHIPYQNPPSFLSSP